MRHQKYQTKRTGRRLPINTTYAAEQAAKRQPFVIKEVPNQPTVAVAKVRQHIIDILYFNDIKEPDEVVIGDLVRKYRDNALCDIKEHLILKHYWQVEDLTKYLIK